MCVRISHRDELTRGQTVVDKWTTEKNVRVLLEVDAAALTFDLLEALHT